MSVEEAKENFTKEQALQQLDSTKRGTPSTPDETELMKNKLNAAIKQIAEEGTVTHAWCKEHFPFYTKFQDEYPEAELKSGKKRQDTAMATIQHYPYACRSSQRIFF